MDALEPKEQTLDKLCDSLLEESKLRMPRHRRQMNLLKARKEEVRGTVISWIGSISLSVLQS